MFDKNRIYMHEKSLDVCFFVYEVRSVIDGKQELLVDWINLGYTGNPWVFETGLKILAKTDGFVDITLTYKNKRITPGLPNLIE
jgi:hypothetical protein